jgi:hypothetical protein
MVKTLNKFNPVSHKLNAFDGGPPRSYLAAKRHEKKAKSIISIHHWQPENKVCNGKKIR